MSKLKKERLDQMIENALSYQQEGKTLQSITFLKRLKVTIFKPNIYGLSFASFIISCIFVPQILTYKSFVDINEINDLITFEIIEEF